MFTFVNSKIIDMRKNIILALSLFFSGTLLFAQQNSEEQIRNALSEIETNNTTLKALKLETDATILDNKSGLNLADPEVGFNYLWGSPSDIGKRKDFSVTQSFDFPTLLGYRSDVARQQNMLAEVEYRRGRIELLLEAQKLIIELISYNSLLDELNIRYGYADKIVEAYQKGFDLGETNVLDLNKAKMEIIKIRNDVKRIDTEREIVSNTLKTLNGGVPVEITATYFDPVMLPQDFDTWYMTAQATSPVLEYVRANLELTKEEVKYNKSLWAPTITAGYMSEDIVGEKFQGITLGVSVPLWSNKNKIKQAKAAVRAAESAEYDAKLQFYNYIFNVYTRTRSLGEIASDYTTGLTQVDNAALLMKALNAGQISLLDYIMETQLYYELITQKIEAEKEFRISLADLYATEL